MPSNLDPRRRTAIYTLAGFIAGALLATAVLGVGPRHVATLLPVTLAPAVTASAPAGAPGAAAASGTSPASPAQPTASAASTASLPSAGTAPAEPSSTDTGLDDSALQLDASDWPENGPTPEQVFTAQPAAVKAALGTLAKRTPGKPNLYAVAVAADGSEDVFRNEAEYLDRAMASRLGNPGHTLVLENNPATLSSYPLASWTNLEAAVDGLAKVMNLKEDILLVYVATHGGSDHSLLVDMDPIPLDQLDPAGLATILGKHGFRWKVVVVNACYSGGFVPKLRGEGTLVITSARSDRTSFGCGSDSDITYFGHAWLVNGLSATPDFIDAFNKAKVQIAGWEKDDAVTPSEPQMDMGAGIEDKLAAWRKTLKPGPPTPFHPAQKL